MQRDSTTQSIITGDVFKRLCRASVSFKSLTSTYTRKRGLPLSVGQYHEWFFFCLSCPHRYTAKPDRNVVKLRRAFYKHVDFRAHMGAAPLAAPMARYIFVSVTCFIPYLLRPCRIAPASPLPRAADFRMQRHSSLLFASFSSDDAEAAGYSFHSPKKMEAKPVVSKIFMICGPTFSRITPSSEFFFMMSSTRSPAEDMY